MKYGLGIINGTSGLGIINGTSGLGIINGTSGLGISNGTSGLGIINGTSGLGIINGRSVLGIINGTSGLGIINGRSGLGITITFKREKIILVAIHLEIFADADYEPSKATDRRYVSSGAIVCGGVCNYWFSRTLHFLTSKAEYVALNDAVKMLLF